MGRVITISLHRGRPAQAPPRAAGVLIVSRQRRVLLLKRAESAVHGGTWCWPGGKMEPGETTGQAALRELKEETQLMQPLKLLMPIWDEGGFCLYLAVATEFTPLLDGEHQDFQWCHLDKLPSPLHPHVEEQARLLRGIMQ